MGGMYMGVRFPDEESYETVRAVLSHESEARGQPVGRAFFELLMEAADIASYPTEVQARLREIAARAEDETVGDCLKPKTAGG